MRRTIIDQLFSGTATADGGSFAESRGYRETTKRKCRPDRVMKLRGAWLLSIVLGLVAAPAWGATFTGQLVLAEGARMASEAVDGRLESVESFTFIEDISGTEYELVEYEGKLPHRSVRGTLFGEQLDAFTIAVESFVETQAVQTTQSASSGSRSRMVCLCSSSTGPTRPDRMARPTVTTRPSSAATSWCHTRAAAVKVARASAE